MKTSLLDITFIMPIEQLSEDIKWATGDGEAYGGKKEETGTGDRKFIVMRVLYMKPRDLMRLPSFSREEKNL